MKYIIFFISIMLSTTLFAQTSAETIGSLIDNYQYDLTVSWDQKDEQQKKLFTQKFLDQLNSQLAAGAKPSEMKKVFSEKLTRFGLSAEAIEKLILRYNLSSDSEVVRFLELNHRYLFNSGASWNGDASVSIALFAGLVLGAIVLVLSLEPKAKCLRQESQYYCKERLNFRDELVSSECGNFMVCAEYARPN